MNLKKEKIFLKQMTINETAPKKKLEEIITTGLSTGDLARTIGRANADTINPIVMKMENSRQGPPEPPESSAYRRAMSVGTGARR